VKIVISGEDAEVEAILLHLGFNKLLPTPFWLGDRLIALEGMHKERMDVVFDEGAPKAGPWMATATLIELISVTWPVAHGDPTPRPSHYLAPLFGPDVASVAEELRAAREAYGRDPSEASVRMAEALNGLMAKMGYHLGGDDVVRPIRKPA